MVPCQGLAMVPKDQQQGVLMRPARPCQACQLFNDLRSHDLAVSPIRG